jgi:hypothetical protein
LPASPSSVPNIADPYGKQPFILTRPQTLVKFFLARRWRAEIPPKPIDGFLHPGFSFPQTEMAFETYSLIFVYFSGKKIVLKIPQSLAGQGFERRGLKHVRMEGADRHYYSGNQCHL